MMRSRSRGSTLIVSLISVAVLALLGVTVYRAIRFQVKEVVYQQRLTQSFHIAQAGLEDAMLELRKNQAWRAGFSKKPLAGGYYTVSVSTGLPPLVTSTGYSRQIALFGRAFTTVSAVAEVTYGDVTASYAIMANNLAQVNGPAAIDAYYVNLNPEPSVFSFGAGIWSNGTVATTAGAVVNGSVYYVNTANLAPNTVLGNVIKSSTTQKLSNNTCGACKNRNDNAAGISPASCYNAATMALTVGAGAACSMAPGTYYFSNITINGTLNVNTSTGSVTVYFNGALNAAAAGTLNNSSKIPSRLLFYGEQSGNTHTMASASPFHAYLEEPAGTWHIHGTRLPRRGHTRRYRRQQPEPGRAGRLEKTHLGARRQAPVTEVVN